MRLCLRGIIERASEPYPSSHALPYLTIVMDGSGLALVARLVLGAFLVVSALAKFAGGYDRLHAAIDAYSLIPTRLSRAIALMLPVCELMLALALFLGAYLVLAVLLTTVLLIAFSAAVALSLVRGGQHGCGCLGEIADRPIGRGTVLQNAALLLAALAALAGGTETGPVWSIMAGLADGLLALPVAVAGVLVLVLWAHADAAVAAHRRWRESTAVEVARGGGS